MSDVLLILLPGAMYFWVLFVGQGPLQEVLEETRILPRILRERHRWRRPTSHLDTGD